MSQSPVVCSQYDPSGQYLAYVTVALDKQRVGVEPATANKLDGLSNDNFLYLENSDLRVTVLQWCELSSSEASVVALGLNNGEIWLYSAAANQIIYKLSTGNACAIKDFQVKGSVAWCCDSNDELYEFSIVDFSLKQKFKLESTSNLSKLCIVDNRQILVASHSISLVDVSKKEVIRTFPGHVSPVQTLTLLTPEFILSGGINDRFLNVYNLTSGATKSVLVAQSNVIQVSASHEHSVAVTTEDGNVEIFPDPMVNTNNKRRGALSKRSTKSLKLIRPDQTREVLPIFNIFINKDILNFTWLENATVPYFDQLQWESLSSSHILEKPLPSSASRSHHRSLYGNDVAAAKSYVEGNATVTSGDNFKYVEEAIADIERDEGDGESLADKLAVSNLNGAKQETKRSKKRATTGTLTVVLSQALQSNDHSLLETVLNTRDERVINATISRLQPQLAVILLERLAERIARQTHRQGPLNVWVKWCLIVHGGYLVGIPNLTSSLSSLHSTLKKRCDLLPRLQVLDTRLERCLNEIEAKRDSQSNREIDAAAPVFEHGTDLDEAEDDVEYNEELDDAGLIEDGEVDYDSSDEDVEEPSRANDTDYTEEKFVDDEEMKVDAEEGYSDVEIDE